MPKNYKEMTIYTVTNFISDVCFKGRLQMKSHHVKPTTTGYVWESSINCICTLYFYNFCLDPLHNSFSEYYLTDFLTYKHCS